MGTAFDNVMQHIAAAVEECHQEIEGWLAREVEAVTQLQFTGISRYEDWQEAHEQVSFAQAKLQALEAFAGSISTAQMNAVAADIV